MKKSVLGIGFVAAAASAASLPIRPGTYVRVGVSCENPPNAMFFMFDGERFRYPHASDCSSKILSRANGEYRVREVCQALGDGTPAKPTAMNYVYRFSSGTRIRMTKFVNGEVFVDEYRRCSGHMLR